MNPPNGFSSTGYSFLDGIMSIFSGETLDERARRRDMAKFYCRNDKESLSTRLSNYFSCGGPLEDQQESDFIRQFMDLGLTNASARECWDFYKKKRAIVYFNGELSTFPQLEKFQDIRVIDFRYNQITKISDLAIQSILQIERLILRGNAITSFPESIGDLKRLRYLDLSDCKLDHIPECIFRLPSFCEVKIENHSMTMETVYCLRDRMNQKDYKGPKINYTWGWVK